jgi:hypothetical protein
MLWYNILNPREWPGVTIKTGNNKIDGVYYNLLSSNHVSLAASGSMFLAANSGIQLISPSFIDASGYRANKILAQTYERIDNTGGIIPLYSGDNSGILVKLNNNTAYSTNIISYNSGENTLQFPSASAGAVLYTRGSNKTIKSYNPIQLVEASGEQKASISFNAPVFANSGISLGPNNYLDSYKGFILTHDGSGNVAQWKPATYLRENYNTNLPLDGLERIGINWIRYPKRPALLKNGKLYIYSENRSWSPYDSISDLSQLETELGNGTDTICVETVKGDVVVGYTKFAFVAKAPSQQDINQSYIFEDNVKSNSEVVDPDNIDPSETSTPTFELEIAPEYPNGISEDEAEGVNVFIFSVTKGAYFPMQLEPNATDNITYKDNLGDDVETELTFKPSTLNNISIRPKVHTAFNMLAEDIDFIVYGKKTIEFNNYNSSLFDLNDNFIPQGLVSTFKIDANIPNSVSGSPTGVVFTKFIDRNKTIPTGWSFEDKGKVCINTNDAYAISSITSGNGLLSSYADLTVSGVTFSNSLVVEDIFLRPKPNIDNNGKYVRNALLTVNSEGQIVSRSPRINPTVPDAPSGVVGITNGFGGVGNNEYSIKWDAPVNDGRSSIINYLIQFSSNGGENWTTLPTETTSVLRGFNTQTSATIFQLPVSAIFRVAAQNSVGISNYSEATENTFVSNTGLPQLPTNFNFVRNIDNETLSDITLSWIATNSWGSSAASGYLIEESSDNGNEWYSVAFVDSSTLSYTDTGLDGTTNYLYRISSKNVDSGISAYNYIYSTGLLFVETDIEEEENRREDELSNFDFGVIMFTGTCVN